MLGLGLGKELELGLRLGLGRELEFGVAREAELGLGLPMITPQAAIYVTVDIEASSNLFVALCGD